MEVYVSGDQIVFKSDKVKSLGFTDYNESLWHKVKEMKWNVRFSRPKNKEKRKPYIYSSNRGNKVDLHRFVMEHWYGESIMKDAKKRDYVVDHLSNESLNCRISNLCFIPRTLNTSKGNDFDIRRKEAEKGFALNIFKDFRTQMFQITIVFNIPASFVDVEKNKKLPLAKLFLLYENKFRRVLADSQTIINEIIYEGVFDVKKLNHKEHAVEIANYVISPEQKDSPVVFIDGKAYANMGLDAIKFTSIPPYKRLFEKYDTVFDTVL
ncbi:hypothetical protein CN902_24120 [Priestia megaterium]|uniref:HNH endonuclease n=1 Tax=Priestia megaterium TaxID=1404 RepID=UPI000BFE8E70|nr:HNH endonuclease [Priestia megaterium]PGK25183.1 hypothetical protein CN902_24120 [Priestia megaterium]